MVLAAVSDTVVWHDLECGAYSADLALWRELAGAAGPGAAVLDLGAGSGRVSLELARHGHRVTALDREGDLLEALSRRAQDQGAAVDTVHADAREFALAGRRFDLCLVPMQTIQLLSRVRDREALMRCARAHMRPGAVLACAIVTDLEAFDFRRGGWGPAPEHDTLGEREYVSRAVRIGVQRHSFTIERERRVLAISADGEAPHIVERSRDLVRLARVSAAGLHREGERAGLHAAGTRHVRATAEHVGSEVVLLRA